MCLSAGCNCNKFYSHSNCSVRCNVIVLFSGNKYLINLIRSWSKVHRGAEIYNNWKICVTIWLHFVALYSLLRNLTCQLQRLIEFWNPLGLVYFVWCPRGPGTVSSSVSLWSGTVRTFTVHILTNLLTPWCRVLLEQLTGLQLVMKFHAFHGTRRFITALTSVRQLSLSWASPIQSIYPHPTSCRSIIILSTHLLLGFPSGSFPPISPPRP